MSSLILIRMFFRVCEFVCFGVLHVKCLFWVDLVEYFLRPHPALVNHLPVVYHGILDVVDPVLGGGSDVAGEDGVAV